MKTYDIQDKLLTSTGPTEVIDLGEVGGSEHAFIVIEGSGSAEVEACATADGEFKSLVSMLIADEPYIIRIPYDCPRYIRLASTGATLTVRV